MKKLLSLLLTVVIVVGMVGCSSKDIVEDTTDNTKVEEQLDTEGSSDEEAVEDEDIELEELYGNDYEGYDTCPNCGKLMGLKLDGTTYCAYCGENGTYETQADRQKEYEDKTYQDGYNDGYGVGFDIGIVNGEKNITSYSNDREAYLNEEYENGYSEGWQKGYSEGWNIGYKRYENTPEENEEDQNVKQDNYNHLEEEAKENGTYEEFEEHDDSYYE